jgi:metal-dependent HD superfamily phosphatase/phosphodiesterase
MTVEPLSVVSRYVHRAAAPEYEAVADATDITSGRGKISFAAGKIYIHAVSALSIRNVAIKPGNYGQAVAIEVDMSGEAGIFRVPAEMLRRTSA